MLKEIDPRIEKKLSDKIGYLKEQGLDSREIVVLANKLLKVSEKKEIEIPASVFYNDYLGCLETIVKYLRENLQLSFKQIALLTNRNEIALAVSYRNARRKLEPKFTEEKSSYNIPVSILKGRNLSVLENIVVYLRDHIGLSYHKIAWLLNRNDRTIWTVYQRANTKKNAR